MDQQHALRVAVKLATTRELHNWSIKELSTRSHVDRATIWRIEQGNVLDIRPKTLVALSTALGVSPCDIFYSAGWLDKWELPALDNYLRGKFPALPGGARKKIEMACVDIATEYGLTLTDFDVDRPRVRRYGPGVTHLTREMEERLTGDAANA